MLPPKISGRQAEALAFIIGEIVEKRTSPTFGEIARHLSVSQTRAKTLVADLIERGLVSRTPGAQRALRVNNVADSRRQLAEILRDLGWIAADAEDELRAAAWPKLALVGVVTHDVSALTRGC